MRIYKLKIRLRRRNIRNYVSNNDWKFDLVIIQKLKNENINLKNDKEFLSN